MKQSIRNVISLVKKSIREINSDSRLSNKFVWSKIHSFASLIIPQYSDKLSINNEMEIYQIWKCVDIIEVPAIDPNCYLTSSFSVYRTKCKVPLIYFDSSGPLIRSIRTVDRSFQVTLATLDYIQAALEDTNSKYDKTIYAWYEEGYLYITKKLPVRIEGLFVFDISNQESCDCIDDKPCKRFMDSIWYCPSRLQNQIIEQVINSLAGTYKKIPEQQLADKNSTT